jgi:hypothetical protein
MFTKLECIESLRQNNTSHLLITSLYNTCYKIAMATLAQRYSRQSCIFLNSDNSYESVASDAITPLFISNKPNEPIGIQRSVLQWDGSITNEAQADFFIHKIVWNRVAQHITKLLKETDPFFKKIHSSLKRFIDKNNYNRIPYLGIMFITESHNKKILNRIISNEEIENLPCNLFFGKYDDVFKKLFNYIENDTDYFPAIPLNALIRKLKSLNRKEYFNPLLNIPTPSFEEGFDIDCIIEDSLTQVYDTIEKFYSKSSKIDENISKAYKSALRDMAEDMKCGKTNKSLFDYLRFYMSSLTNNEFYNTYHSQLNYLKIQLKKAVTDKIKLN